MGRVVRRARVRARAFFRGVMRGVASPADTFIVNTYSYPHESEQEAMRQDWYRVGEDFREAMKKSDVQAAA